jgi:hypothetical protein
MCAAEFARILVVNEDHVFQDFLRARVLVRRNDNAGVRAGFDIDMWIDAVLADQLQVRETLQ